MANIVDEAYENQVTIQEARLQPGHEPWGFSWNELNELAGGGLVTNPQELILVARVVRNAPKVNAQ